MKNIQSGLILVVALCVLTACIHSAPYSHAVDRWKKLKFGLFLHWGPYAKLTEEMELKAHDLASWPIEWSSRQINNPKIRTKEDMSKFREYYFNLPSKFNPEKFDPTVWANAAHRAGMRYVVMTTKHHDGFNMYDTKLDDFSVMGKICPFKKDAFGEVMNAFRKKDFFLGAYYSKADWHRPDFWNPSIFSEGKEANYDTSKDPKRWQSFKKYVHGQIHEIVDQYKVDLLWFDGAWVRPTFEDLDFSEINNIAKKINPDILLVNRRGGTFEDYLTPEQVGIPDAPLQKPWEICMTMATQWAYKKNDTYKSTQQLLNTVVSVVARGGNLLLDVGPQPDGQLPADALKRLNELGDWMDINSESIHDSEPIFPYHYSDQMSLSQQHNFHLTRKNQDVYVFFMQDDLPEVLKLPFVTPTGIDDFHFKLGSVNVLGTDVDIPFRWENNYLVLQIPKSFNSKSKFITVFKLSE